MSQSLPCGEFKWVENFDETKPFDYDPSKGIGYIHEVDLDYPKNLHEYYNIFPLTSYGSYCTTTYVRLSIVGERK